MSQQCGNYSREQPKAQDLNGKRVVILAVDGFEQVELTEPREAAAEAGAETHVISPAEGRVKGWKVTDWGSDVPVDAALSQGDVKDYDALMLPGGVMNPDALRINADALALVKGFFDAGKPVAAICHAPWTLIDAGVIKGHRMTSWPSLRSDLKNAGAQWVDEEVVTDQGLVTSRNPDDLPAFNTKMIEEFTEGATSAAPPPGDTRRLTAPSDVGIQH